MAHAAASGMQHRTSLPILATLFALLLALPACDDGGSGGEGGDVTGNAGGSGGTGGTGGSGGTGGTGGGDTLAQCTTPEVLVAACVHPGTWPPAGAEPTTPFAKTGTVTAVRARMPGEDCFLNEDDSPLDYFTIHGEHVETLIDLVDADGEEFTVGFSLGSVTSDIVGVGDVLEVEATTNDPIFAVPLSTSISVRRDGQLLASAGKNHPLGFDLGVGGASTCIQERNYCYRDEAPVAVQRGDAPAVVIDNGASAEVGDLTVINDRFYKVFEDSGPCNFGADVDYVIGAHATPAP